MRLGGIAFQVRYEIDKPGDVFQHGKGVRPMQWTKCSVHLPDDGQLPDGSYFLYTDDVNAIVNPSPLISRKTPHNGLIFHIKIKKEIYSERY